MEPIDATVAQLRETIDALNEGRPADEQIPTSGTKAELVERIAAAQTPTPAPAAAAVLPDRLRVRDADTGHERTIPAAHLPHGNYELLDEPAVDPVTGEDISPVFNTPTAGRQAGEKKEND